MKKDIKQLIGEYAQAKKLYAEEWLLNYDQGYKLKACDMKTDTSSAGMAYNMIKQELEFYLRGNIDEQD